eukprot:12385231-Heterocapsa_arctica.AAC.1
MVTHGFQRFLGEPQLYQHTVTKALVSIHADDILIAASPDRVEEVKTLMELGLKIRWGDSIDGNAWTRCLGKDWKRTDTGFMVRVPE